MSDHLSPTACPFCSLHCDDLHLEVDGGRVLRCTPRCMRAEAGFEKPIPPSRPESATAESLDQTLALEKAAVWLDKARQPLVVVGGMMDLSAVRAAIRLARFRSAVLDQDDMDNGTRLAAAMRLAGILTGTLGELQQHADQLVLCGSEPGDEVPRFWEFFGENRRKQAIRVATADPLTAVRKLRLALRKPGNGLDPAWAPLAGEIEEASGLVIFGGDWLRAGSVLLNELLLWIQELNATGHWYGLPFSAEADRLGVTEAFLAETGYPGNVRFIDAQGTFSPDEWQAERLLRRGAVDVVVFAGDPHGLSRAAFAGEGRTRVKSILISTERPDWKPDLWFPVAQPGLDAGGEMLRLDGVPIQLQPIGSVERSTAMAILSGLMPGEVR